MLLFEMMAFHPALKDENGGHTIYSLAPFLDGKIRFAQQAVSFGGGEALVPEMNRQLEMLAEVHGKGLDLFGLRAFGSGHSERQSDDDFFDFVLQDDPPEKLEIVLLVLAVKGFEALGSNTEGIRNGDADSSSPDIEAQHTVVRLSCHSGIIEGAERTSDFRPQTSGFRPLEFSTEKQ